MNLLCKLGFHHWGYRAKNTGIYLHTFANGQLPKPASYYTGEKKCWDCGKEDKNV